MNHRWVVNFSNEVKVASMGSGRSENRPLSRWEDRHQRGDITVVVSLLGARSVVFQSPSNKTAENRGNRYSRIRASAKTHSTRLVPIEITWPPGSRWFTRRPKCSLWRCRNCPSSGRAALLQKGRLRRVKDQLVLGRSAGLPERLLYHRKICLIARRICPPPEVPLSRRSHQKTRFATEICCVTGEPSGTTSFTSPVPRLHRCTRFSTVRPIASSRRCTLCGTVSTNIAGGPAVPPCGSSGSSTVPAGPPCVAPTGPTAQEVP